MVFFPQPGLQTPFNLTAETNITAIKYFHHHYQSYQVFPSSLSILLKYLHHNYQSYQSISIIIINLITHCWVDGNCCRHFDHDSCCPDITCKSTISSSSWYSTLFFLPCSIFRPQVLQQHAPPSWPDGSVDWAHGLRQRPVLNLLPIWYM